MGRKHTCPYRYPSPKSSNLGSVLGAMSSVRLPRPDESVSPGPDESANSVHRYSRAEDTPRILGPIRRGERVDHFASQRRTGDGESGRQEASALLPARSLRARISSVSV